MFETLISLLGDAARSLGAAGSVAEERPAMTTGPDLYASQDDLPPEARELIAEAERTARQVREHVTRRGDQIRAAAEDEVRAIRRRSEGEARALEVEATRELTPALRSLFDGLRALQEGYARLGKLDEALAIRANLRQLRAELLGIRADPGTLSDFGTEFDERPLLFEVAGRTDGALWGSGPYTLDSHLGTAAVHAGLIKPGLRGLVRVTPVPSEFREYVASARHGVQSSEYAGTSRGYAVDAAE